MQHEPPRQRWLRRCALVIACVLGAILFGTTVVWPVVCLFAKCGI